MSFLVFDLDETLANVYSVYYFLASLKLQETVRDTPTQSNSPVPVRVQRQLQHAYELFVDRVLTEEESDHPLGILRPGILEVMTVIRDLQEAGAVQCVTIYSNNSHLESLHFVRDLIHRHLQTNDLIRDCIHWNHPKRGEERVLIPGFPNKTWSVLKRIMEEGPCQAPRELQPHQVHFFDDLDHWDLKRVLGPNYHQVPPYRFKASFDRLEDIYRSCIKDAQVDLTVLQEYVESLFATKDDIIHVDVNDKLNGINQLFDEKTHGTASPDHTPPLWDGGVEEMTTVNESLLKGIRNKRRGGRGRRGGARARARARTRTQRRRVHGRGATHTNRKRARFA
jgi:hypothetical protein